MHLEKRNWLHALELPVAHLARLFAQSRQDPKKGKKIQLRDMCFFAKREDFTNAEPIYGACMGAAIKAGVFPPFAYFIFQELKDTMDNQPAPVPVLYAADLVVLAPNIKKDRISGLILAESDLTPGTRLLKSLDGDEYLVETPEHHLKCGAWASDDIVLKRVNLLG